MIQQTVQIVAGSVWVLFASPIASAISPQWWYGLGAILAGIQLLVSVFLLPETKYDRSQKQHRDFNGVCESVDSAKPVISTKRPRLDFNKYKARTWRSDMRPWIGSPEWYKVYGVLKVRNV